MITVRFACTRSTRAERSCGRNRNRDNRPPPRADYTLHTRGRATECVARVATVFVFGAIVVRPSSSVVVSRRPSLPCAPRVCVCVYVVCFHVRGPCETPSRPRSGGPTWRFEFLPFLFLFAARPAADFRGSLRRAVRPKLRRSIFNRIPAGHGTGVPDTRFFSLDRLA